MNLIPIEEQQKDREMKYRKEKNEKIKLGPKYLSSRKWSSKGKDKRKQWERNNQEINQENFLEMKGMALQIERALWVPSITEGNRPSPRHMIVQFQYS